MGNQIKEAISFLKQGELVIYPTESSYAIGADFLNPKAIEKVHALKQEPKDKPLGIIISNLNQIKSIASLNLSAIKLANKFFPGQLNLIVKKIDSEETISFRIPNNPITLELASKFDSPITATSANIHNSPALYEIEEIKRTFQDKVSLIIDAGDLNEKIPVSTIFDTTKNKTLRQGLITEAQILDLLKQ